MTYEEFSAKLLDLLSVFSRRPSPNHVLVCENAAGKYDIIGNRSVDEIIMMLRVAADTLESGKMPVFDKRTP